MNPEDQQITSSSEQPNSYYPEPADSQDQYRLPHDNKKDVTTKVAIVLIAVFGVVSLGLGFWLMQNRLSSPFITELVLNQPNGSLSTDDQLELELRSKDTDGDSLNDYEEVYVFNTSPYLRDTDSDGIDDGTEINQGQDPNCAAGTECTGIRVLTPEAKISDLFPQFSPTDSSLKDKTIQEFRQILIDSGMEPDVVASFTDDFIIFVVEAVVLADDTLDEPTSIDELSDQEIREFLIDVGLRPDEVNRIPPDELRDLIRTLL